MTLGLRAGAKLKAARERLGYSLESVAQRLRVQRTYLDALEAMNLKMLPGRAYTLAYMRSYAELVGLDPDALVSQFQRESALAREDVAPQIRDPESKPRRERPWLAAAAIGVVALSFVGFRALQDSGDARLVETPSAPEAAPSAHISPIPASPTPRAVEGVGLRPVVEIRPNAPAWLEVRGPDGTIFLSQVIEPGQVYRPDVGAGWTLHARDGGAFDVVVDGVARGTLGDENAPVLGRRVDLIAEEAAADFAAPPTAPDAGVGPPPQG